VLQKDPWPEPTGRRLAAAGAARSGRPLDTAFASANDDVNPRPTLTRVPAGSGAMVLALINVSANTCLLVARWRLVPVIAVVLV
jgi:hypothetical protein